jgi:GT2 family glycosyltransferase
VRRKSLNMFLLGEVVDEKIGWVLARDVCSSICHRGKELKCLSIIIVNYNNPELLGACLKSIYQYLAGIKKEIIVVDNNSTLQNLSAHQEQYPDLKVIYLHANMGFGYANNVGVKNAAGDILLLLNSDTEFIDTSFKALLASFHAIQFTEIWGPRLIWSDGKFQQSYSKEISFVDFLTNYTSLYSLLRILHMEKGHKYNYEEFVSQAEVDVIYGTALLINKSVYEKLGGFSQKYFMYFEDVDLCDRFRKELGGRIKFDPATTLIHRAKGSSVGSSINLKFTRSKYIYATRKFGYIATAVIFPLDVIFGVIKGILRKVINSRHKPA